jgi:hypothetical protein
MGTTTGLIFELDELSLDAARNNLLMEHLVRADLVHNPGCVFFLVSLQLRRLHRRDVAKLREGLRLGFVAADVLKDLGWRHLLLYVGRILLGGSRGAMTGDNSGRRKTSPPPPIFSWWILKETKSEF